jgi:hypothetical protein
LSRNFNRNLDGKCLAPVLVTTQPASSTTTPPDMNTLSSFKQKTELTPKAQIRTNVTVKNNCKKIRLNYMSCLILFLGLL